MKKYKKYLTIILIVCLMMNVFVQPSYAEYGFDDYLLCQALILAGVAVTSGVVYTQAKKAIMDAADSEQISAISNLSAQMTAGVLLLPATTWGIIKTLTDGVFNPGTNDQNIPGGMRPGTNADMGTDNILGPWQDGAISNGKTYSYTFSNNTARFYRNGGEFSNASGIATVYGMYINTEGALCYRAKWQSQYNGGAGFDIICDTAPNITDVNFKPINIPITGSTQIDDPTRTFGSTYVPPDKTQETTGTYGQMALGVPSNVLDGTKTVEQAMLDDLYGKTKEQVQDLPLSNTGVVEEPIDPPVEGTLEGIAALVNACLQAIQAIPVAISTFFDLTLPVNLEPLKMAGTEFTNRFPFSLPWDLLGSFLIFSGESTFDGIFEFTLMDNQFTVDMTAFVPFVNIIKMVELTIFDICLIMGTRRLLGGAS